MRHSLRKCSGYKKLMNDNLIKVLSLYCNSEIDDLKKNELFIKLLNMMIKMK